MKYVFSLTKMYVLKNLLEAITYIDMSTSMI